MSEGLKRRSGLTRKPPLRGGTLSRSSFKPSGGGLKRSSLSQGGAGRLASAPASGEAMKRAPMRQVSERRLREIEAARAEGKSVNPRKPARKSKRFIDEVHLAFIRTLPCLVCGHPGGCDAHHLLRVPERAMARKADDNHAVPLCHRHHMELHDDGNEKRFLAERAGIADPVSLSENLHKTSGNAIAAERMIATARADLKETKP